MCKISFLQVHQCNPAHTFKSVFMFSNLTAKMGNYHYTKLLTVSQMQDNLVEICEIGGTSSPLFHKSINSWRLFHTKISQPCHDKTNKMSVRLAKTQVSLGIRQVLSASSLCAQWVAKDPSFLHADSEDSDQTGRCP